MKKGIASILLVLYFAFSSGVVVNLHYCMDRFDSMKLGDTQSRICGKCGMHTDESNGCCHDSVKVLKIDDAQNTTGNAFAFQLPDFLNLSGDNFQLASIVEPLRVSSGIDSSPPFSRQYTYLQNCVFRI
jgi:hypothetical protein